MLSVEEAISAITYAAGPLAAETISISVCKGRIAAEDIAARLTQPPFAASAMDGYAVRFSDAKPGVRLRVLGEAPAGAPFSGSVGAGGAVRIFTGGAIPDGADHVVIQEDVRREGDSVVIEEAQDRPRNIRDAGIDFRAGDILAIAGERLHEIHGAVFAAGNIAAIAVHRRPRVAIFSNGDELVEPGSGLKPGQVVNSNHYALTEMAKSWGAETTYLGCAVDSEPAIREHFARGRAADVIVAVGGASVGDYDYVKTAFVAEGGEIGFEKIAVRPGKPTWFGRLGEARVVGLPGNPASAIVTAALFLQPLVRRLAGLAGGAVIEKAISISAIEANGGRESYLRAALSRSETGALKVQTAPNQDSSLLSPFANADALIRRTINAPAVRAGGAVEIVRLR